MLNEKIQSALNDQITAELFASELYTQMAFWLKRNGYLGFSQYMLKNSDEEFGHMRKFATYLDDRFGVVNFRKIEAPREDWNSIVDLFEDVLTQEQTVTAMVHNMAILAMNESDLATVSFLKWAIDEQVASENEIATLLQQLKSIESDQGAILLFDREYL